MTMTIFERYAAFVTVHSWRVIAMGLLATVVMAFGLGRDPVAPRAIGEAELDTPAHQALERIQQSYDLRQPVESYIIVRTSEDDEADALSQFDVLNGLRFQAALRTLPEVAVSLRPGDGLHGFENLIGKALCAFDNAAEPITLDGRPWEETGRVPQGDCPLAVQIARLEALTASEYEPLREAVLSPSSSPMGANLGIYLPMQVDEGVEDDFRARAIVMSQHYPAHIGLTEEAAHQAQLAVQSELSRWFDDAFIYGEGIVKAESTRAVTESFRYIAHIGGLLLVALLVITFRSMKDIVLCLVGLMLVLLWLQGIRGWLQVPSTSILIAVPFLLVGLAIDYSLHVVMRYREQLEGVEGVPDVRQKRRAIQWGLLGVLPALCLAAFSTAVGFLANYFSPLVSIRDFAVVSGLGIVATFLIFSAIVPAIKTEMEKRCAGRKGTQVQWALGRRRIGSGRWLAALARFAVRRPSPIALGAAVVCVAGAIAATGLKTSFDRTDFIPTAPPQWMQILPAVLAPGRYEVRENVDYLVDHFRLLSRLLDAEILVEGEVTDPDFLHAIERVARRRATESGTLITDSPASLMRLAAFHDAGFAQAVRERDEDGDGLPDRDIVPLYDALFELAPERAARVLHRVDGRYESARLEVALLLNAQSEAIASDIREVARHLSEHAPVHAIATGPSVISANVQNALFNTLVIGFSITLCVIGVLLTVLYGWLHGGYGIGTILLVPVLIALAALLGAMRLLDIPFNSETVVISSLAIGIGVDYSVHIGERFLAQERLAASLAERMETVLTGTGGALLGSTATTVGGFGVLALAISPPLQRFGIVTALAILLTFIATMLVLPALLVLRERWIDRKRA